VRVVIAGAGISGLALAGGLQRSGHQVTVLEAAPQLRTGGAAISLWHNGALALQHLGGDVGNHGCAIDALELCSAKGGVVGRIDAAALSRSIGVTAVTISRGELLEQLAAQLEPGTIRFASPCRGVIGTVGGAIAEVAGAAPLEADLVVGADGQHSAVRKRFAPEQPATPTGWASLQGLTAVPLPVTEGTTSLYVTGPGGAVGLMPAGRGLLQWWFDVPWPPPTMPSSTVQWLRQRFAHWASPVRDLLEVIGDDEIEPFPHAWHRIPRQLQSNHIVLIGDAVHAIPPVLAQGANQSIEDAWVLARELERAPSVSQALVRYQHQRRRKVALVSRAARAPMLQLYGAMGRGPKDRPLLPGWFCTGGWKVMVAGCSSTVKVFGGPREVIATQPDRSSWR
jgi:FAD-dependent urate hydroxylase